MGNPEIVCQKRSVLKYFVLIDKPKQYLEYCRELFIYSTIKNKTFCYLNVIGILYFLFLTSKNKLKQYNYNDDIKICEINGPYNDE